MDSGTGVPDVREIVEMVMNKSKLVETLAQRIPNLTKKKAEAVVNTIFQQMSESLCRDDRIEIRGFGSFQVNSYPSYVGRNPRTGDTIQVPPKKLPFFKVGKELKERVNSPYATAGAIAAEAAGPDDDDEDVEEAPESEASGG
jgi:integration host factor subunit beta